MSSAEPIYPDISDWYTPERISAEEPQWEQGAAYKNYVQRILQVCRLYDLHSVVEVGCGTGWIPLALDSSLLYIAGIDKNPYMIDRSRKKNPGKTFIECDIRDMGGLLVSADLVCSFAVLKHFSLAEWSARLRDILRLAPYGLFTQHVLLDGRSSMNTGDDGFHVIWPTRSEVLQAINDAGHELLSLDEHSLYNEEVGAPESIIVTRRKA